MENPDIERVVESTDFLPVTEQAAIASSRWLGRGDNKAADQAAVDAMRATLGKMPISGTVVIGEGQKDEAPELYVGEELGTGGMECEIAVDPVEGTDLVARGDSEALAICAIGDPGGFLSAPGRKVHELTVIVLDRPRHAELIEEIRSHGARIRLIPDGDITASLSVAVRGTGDHLYVGMGGSTEGVITAAALECLGGEIQAKMWVRGDEDREKMAQFGMDRPDRVYHTRDLASAPRYVIATGITDGNLLKGVRYFADGARTHSIVMDLVTSTVRFIDTVHLLSPTLIREIRLI